MYRPNYATVNGATPQSDPDLFPTDEIQLEMKHLLRLNKRYGTHPLRVEAYTKLARYLLDNRSTD